MKIKPGFIFGLAAVLFALACSDGTAGLNGGNSGNVNVLLTDAPFPFAEVKSVDVFVVRIDGKLVETNDVEAENESDMSEWKTLVTPNKLINLLDFANGKTTSLGVATLPAGTYESFRLILDTDKSSITLADGTKPDVKWPGSGKHGVKIKLDEPVVIDHATPNLLIDFDVGRSFRMRGNSISKDGLLFKPVIRGTSQQTGSVTGSVHGDNATGPAIAEATVEVLKDGTTLTDTNDDNIVKSGKTDASGNFNLTFLHPGTYVLRATPKTASGYKPAILTGVVIAEGTVTSGKGIVVTK